MDPLTGIAIAGAATKGVSDLSNLIGSWVSYADNKQFRDTQAQYQKELNEQAQRNYEEQFQFQKDVWEQTKQREDTAISRRVRDMQAAGLNPVAATGAGAASVGTVSTPVLSSSHSSPINLQQSKFDSIMQLAQFKMQQNMNDANIKLVNAETDLKREQARTEALRPAQIEAQTQLILNNSKLTEEEIESKNYKQVEEAIVAGFITEHPELKKDQVEAELRKTGLENDLIKEKTTASKWKRIQDSIKIALYGLNTVMAFAF